MDPERWAPVAGKVGLLEVSTWLRVRPVGGQPLDVRPVGGQLLAEVDGAPFSVDRAAEAAFPELVFLGGQLVERVVKGRRKAPDPVAEPMVVEGMVSTDGGVTFDREPVAPMVDDETEEERTSKTKAPPKKKG